MFIVSGAVGLEPTIIAIENGKNVALANKEALVVGGDLVMSAVQKNDTTFLGVVVDLQ